MYSVELMEWRHRVVTGIEGPLLFAERIPGISYEAIVEVMGPNGRSLTGQVLDLSTDVMVIQVLGETQGLSPANTMISGSARSFEMELSPLILGRIMDGKGRVRDDLPPYPVAMKSPITGSPINPTSREVPREYVSTGISSIDVMNTLVKGQKLPIFSNAGLPSNELAAMIVRSASVVGARELCVVFAGMGITHREVSYFLEEFKAKGSLERTAIFLNMADEPVIERLMAPRCALTAAEYLAFTLGKDVLVVMTDMTHYCEALREVASAREEIPGRRGYPGYLYTDLALIYERAGRIKGNPGTITLIPILTMPDGDITHPIPDLTGYVTEGQLVMDLSLHRGGISPPLNPLSSLSRLMGKVAGISTREDHPKVSDQLYALYAKAMETRRMAAIVGEDNLDEGERRSLAFAESFEQRFLNQEMKPRSLDESLELAWELFELVDEDQLNRIDPELRARKGVKEIK